MKRRHPDSADLAGGLWELVIPLGVGAAVGAAAIVILRAAGLRFTWALLGAPVAYLAWAIDWQAGLACATASAPAGRRRPALAFCCPAALTKCASA